MLKKVRTLAVLGLTLLVSLFVGSLIYTEGGPGAAAASSLSSYFFNSGSAKTAPTMTAPKVNSSSYSTPTYGSTFSKDSNKNSDRLVPGTSNKAYGATTNVPQPAKKK